MDQQSGRPLGVLLLAVLAVFTAQQALFPVLAPLAREVGLGEVQLGLVLTVAAVVFAGTSLLWGRAVDRFGTRSVLLVGLALAAAGVIGFAVVSQLALSGFLDPDNTLTLMILTRSVLFGAGVGAVPVAALTYVSTTTSGETDRTRAVGQLGAVQGVAIALGPALGGLLGFAGLLGPIWLAPAVVALVFALVVVALPRPAAAAHRPAPPRATLKPWDPRIWPFLLAGFLLFLSLGVVLIVLGFLFQDRLGLDAAGTVRLAGASSFATGLVLVVVQGVVVPRLGWPALRLLRTGIPIAGIGLLALVVAPDFWTMTGSSMVMGLGLALAIPGYTTAPTLRVRDDEQGGVAGLINATNGATFVVGPLAGTALYQLDPRLPMLAGAASCLFAWTFVTLHPGVRQPAPTLPEAQ